MTIILIKLINIIMMLFLPFIMLGIIKKTKAFFAGRKGVRVMQPFFDFLRLIKKEPVISKTTSFVFSLAPAIVLASCIFAGFFVPMAGGYNILQAGFDFVVFAYILGLGKFFSLIAAIDTGSSFEGMGASREACFTTIIEPAFFIILASISVAAGFCNFANLNVFWAHKSILMLCIAILTVLALFIMILVECSRVPFDDPTTHLELTMVHEVMILDNSGIDLAFLTWASGIKMFLISALIATVIIPFQLPYAVSLLAFLAVIFLVAVGVGVVESGIARFRMSHLFEFIFTMSAAALIILALVAIKVYGG